MAGTKNIKDMKGMGSVKGWKGRQDSSHKSNKSILLKSSKFYLITGIMDES